MEVEHLILEDDTRGYFENMSDLDAFIVVGVVRTALTRLGRPTAVWAILHHVPKWLWLRERSCRKLL